MARRYTTLGQVVDQLKINNETNVDINQGIAGLENMFGKFFADLSRNNLESKRETQKPRDTSKATQKQRSGGLQLGGGLGGLLAGAGIGLGAAGAGIGAFFLGLAGADVAINKFGDGEGLKKLLTNLADGLAAFSTRDLLALGAVLGAGAIFGAVPLISGMGAGIGVAAIGLGIGAFFSALAAGDMAIGAMESTGENLTRFMQNFAEGLGALNNDQLIAVGALLGGGAAFGALFGVGKSGKAAIGAAAIGAGIAGFFTALGVGDKLTQMMGVDGEGLKTLMKNVAEGLGALGDDGFVKVAPLLAAGGALGALFGVGASAKAAVGLTAIGAGVAGFFGAMAGVGDLFNKIGVDGSGFKEIFTNIAGALAELNKVDDGVGAKALALAGVGPAMLAFIGSTGLGGLADGVISNAKKAINFLFGTDMETDQDKARKNQIANMVDSLEPLKKLDLSVITGLDKLGKAFKSFAESFESLQKLNVANFKRSITNIAKSLSGSYELLDLMANGGKTGDGYFDGPEIDFGPKGEGGILNPKLKTDELVEQIGKVNFILGKTNVPPSEQKNLSSNVTNNNMMNGGSTANINSGNSTTNNISNNSTGLLMGKPEAIDNSNPILQRVVVT